MSSLALSATAGRPETVRFIVKRMTEWKLLMRKPRRCAKTGGSRTRHLMKRHIRAI